MKNAKNNSEQIISRARVPAGVADLMKVYERFQEAYVITEQYLDIVSPKTHQSNSNQSFVTEGK